MKKVNGKLPVTDFAMQFDGFLWLKKNLKLKIMRIFQRLLDEKILMKKID